MTRPTGNEPTTEDGVVATDPTGAPSPAGTPDAEGAPRWGRPRPAATTGSANRRPWSGTRIAAAATVLGLTLATGYVVGQAGTPTTAPVRATPAPVTHAGHGPGGLQISQDGYTLVVQSAELTAGRSGELAFQIVGPDGAPVTVYQENHDRMLHLVVVGRDLTGYQHVHPDLGPDGTWRARVRTAAAGPYRAFADFWPAGAPQAVTLGIDLAVPGAYAPQPPTDAEETVEVDGYTVTLDGGLRPGESNQVLVWLGKDGRPVDDLQPYLGAYGHLVALRHGDLAYLHVHPATADRSSVLAFSVQVPSAGTYRLFFEFRHGGRVRVAEFTLTAY